MSKQNLSFKRQAIMLRNLISEIAKFAKVGFKTKPVEEQIKIIVICEQCEYYRRNTKLGPRCDKCGCCMNLKKRWATAHCPLKKW